MILVAGGTGRLGGALVALLVGRGIRVRVMSREPSRARSRFGEEVELVEGDVRVAPSLPAALAGVDTVISAITGFGPGGDGPRQVDLEGNRNLIAAAEAAGVKHFVLVSIHGAAAEHPLELYRAKYLAEDRLRESNLDWTIIRPTVFMELWAGIVGDPLIKGGAATVFGQGDNPINFVSVRDVARFLEAAVFDPGLRRTVLEVGGPENLSLNEVVQIIAAGSGREPKARHIPLRALRLGALLMRHVRPDLAGLIEASVQMDTKDMRFDPEEITARHSQIRLTHLVDVVRPERGGTVAA
jgi:uncharacterized protein YbjT (DUF2867 family)